VNDTASLLILQGADIGGLRTVADSQDPNALTGLSNVGGMLTFGEVVLGMLFGLSLLALLDLEDFSLFPSSQHTPVGGRDEGQSEDTEARVGDDNVDGDGGSNGAYRRVGHSPSEENVAPLLPSSRN